MSKWMKKSAKIDMFQVTLEVGVTPELKWGTSDVEDEIDRLIDSSNADYSAAVIGVKRLSKQEVGSLNKEAEGGKVPVKELIEYVRDLIAIEAKEGRRKPSKEDIIEAILADIDAYVDIESMLDDLEDEEEVK
jgi:hypothetical protein